MEEAELEVPRVMREPVSWLSAGFHSLLTGGILGSAVHKCEPFRELPRVLGKSLVLQGTHHRVSVRMKAVNLCKLLRTVTSK